VTGDGGRAAGGRTTRTDNVASFIRAALWGPSLPFSTHPLCATVTSRAPERERERERGSGLLNPCFHSLPETLFISPVSSSLVPPPLPPRNKNPNCEGGGRMNRVAFARSLSLSLPQLSLEKAIVSSKKYSPAIWKTDRPPSKVEGQAAPLSSPFSPTREGDSTKKRCAHALLPLRNWN